MLADIISIAPKLSSPRVLACTAILVTLNVLIVTVSCESYSSVANFSLGIQSTQKCTKIGTNYFPYNRTKTCGDIDDDCESAINCCQYNSKPQACYKISDNGPLYCGPCVEEGESCEPGFTQCCPGYECRSDHMCYEIEACTKEGEVCYPGTNPTKCCDELNCITDSNWESYCSIGCTPKDIPCIPSGPPSCCDGFYCKTPGASQQPKCSCDDLGKTCSPGNTICCDNAKCDPDSRKCCLAENSPCTGDGTSSNCCPGTTCESKQTCERQCKTGDPCKTDKDCCGNLVCALDLLGLLCLEPPPLPLKNDVIL